MDVKQLISKLKGFDSDAIVTCGDSSIGWSNIETLQPAGSCVKIVMSDNVVFSDDRIKTVNTAMVRLLCDVKGLLLNHDIPSRDARAEIIERINACLVQQPTNQE